MTLRRRHVFEDRSSPPLKWKPSSAGNPQPTFNIQPGFDMFTPASRPYNGDTSPAAQTRSWHARSPDIIDDRLVHPDLHRPTDNTNGRTGDNCTPQKLPRESSAIHASPPPPSAAHPIWRQSKRGTHRSLCLAVGPSPSRDAAPARRRRSRIVATTVTMIGTGPPGRCTR